MRFVALGIAPFTDIWASVNDIAAIITALAHAGAEEFLVPNLPNLGRTPQSRAFEAISPGFAAKATAISMAFNSLLAKILAALENRFEVRIHRLDLFLLLEAAIAKPAAFDLTNVIDPCIGQGDVIQDILFGDPTPCSKLDEYLFWDAIHPTAHVHAILGQAALRAVIEDDGEC